MKYYKSTKFTKFVTSTGFIAFTAFVLIAIGALSWFLLSKTNTTSVPQNNDDSNSLNSSYQGTNDSYNNTVEIPDTSETPITDVDDEVSDVPYVEENVVSSPIAEKQSFVLPVTGNVSKGFSDTALQYSATFGDMRLHTGIDILCQKGTDIKSVANGTVKSIVDDAHWGKVITIEYSENIVVKYCGMESVTVKENDSITTADVIGTSGEIPCECADKPHIHIEVYVDGKITSPLAALGLE